MPDEDPIRPTQQPSRPGAWRMTFSYDDEKIELVSSQLVDMIAPASPTREITSDQSGFWIELYSESGEVVHQQQLHPPIRHEYEVFSPEPGAPIRRVPNPRVEGTFDIVVPALPNAAQVVVRGTVRREEYMRNAPAQELGRFKLEKREPSQEAKPERKDDRRDRRGKT